MTELSNGDVFWWGALGSLIAFLVVFVLPEAIKAYRGEQHLAVTFGRFIAAVIIAAIFIAAGGALSIAFGDATQVKQALAYGLGTEGLIGGSLKSFTGK